MRADGVGGGAAGKKSTGEKHPSNFFFKLIFSPPLCPLSGASEKKVKKQKKKKPQLIDRLVGVTCRADNPPRTVYAVDHGRADLRGTAEIENLLLASVRRGTEAPTAGLVRANSLPTAARVESTRVIVNDRCPS